MNRFAYVLRAYPMRGGDYPSMEAPPAELQEGGFKPTFKAPDGTLSPGDPVEYKYLNYIFNDLYAKAADAERRLSALEGK